MEQPLLPGKVGGGAFERAMCGQGGHVRECARATGWKRLVVTIYQKRRGKVVGFSPVDVHPDDDFFAVERRVAGWNTNASTPCNSPARTHSRSLEGAIGLLSPAQVKNCISNPANDEVGMTVVA